MSIEGLEQYSKDQLIDELINRQTFVGVVVYHRGDAKAGEIEPGETVITKSPPLSPEGVANLLNLGKSLLPELFGETPPSQIPTAVPEPLRVHPGGVIRIGESRISLDLIVEQYENGMSPEDMVRAYESLDIAQVYAALAFYLQNKEALRAYFRQREAEAGELRLKIESERPRMPQRELTSQSSAKESADAPPGM